MDRWKGRVAVVSDVNTGVGYVIAKSLAEHGMDVIGCAKDVKAIEVRVFLSEVSIDYKSP